MRQGYKVNVAFYLTPKINVAYLFDDLTLRQSIEKMRFHGYTSIPVITREGKYYGVLSEGDILWYVLDTYMKPDESDFKSIEKKRVSTIMHFSENNPKKIVTAPVRITAQIDELVETAMRQNFVPVVDDNDTFIGIVTRSAIISHLYEKTKEKVSDPET